MQKLVYMKTQILILLLLVGTLTYAKTICQIDVANPKLGYETNKNINDVLKPHQKLKEIKLEVDSLDAKAISAKTAKLYFYTLDSKKFETAFNSFNASSFVWKIDFGRSQIFPQLFKNYLNVIEYNSRYHVRLYDAPSDTTMVNLSFQKNDCREIVPVGKMLTGAR